MTLNEFILKLTNLRDSNNAGDFRMKVREVWEGDGDKTTDMTENHLWIEPDKKICIVDAETEVPLFTDESLFEEEE